MEVQKVGEGGRENGEGRMENGEGWKKGTKGTKEAGGIEDGHGRKGRGVE